MAMKKLRLVFLLYALLFSSFAAPHAVVTADSLPIAPLVAGKAAEIQLRFNSAIEPDLAQFFLISQGDQRQKLASHAGRTAGEIILTIPPLPVGKYALKFKIFAADSHLTEDVIYFFVK